MPFKKNSIPWNKGLKGYMSGEKNPMYGKKHTKKSIRKMRDANIGRKDTEETKIKKSISHKGINPSKWGAGFKKGNIPWNRSASIDAYFAGLIDADGYISIQSNYYKGEPRYKRVAVRVSMVEKNAVEEAKKRYGGFLYQRKLKDRNPFWEWVAQHKVADKVLRQIRPYLRIKKDQADICIRYRNLQIKSKYRLAEIGEKEWALRKELEEKLKSLHLKKGKQT